MITYDMNKCINCNECIRACPVETANCYTKDSQGHLVLSIDGNSCIQCGACVAACHQKARGFTDDTDAFMSDLASGQNIVVIVAPAIKIAYEGYWQNVLNYLKERGAKHIYDVSFGADICTWAHIRYLSAHPEAKVISQPCAAIAEYCLKHKNELLPSLSPVHSPMSCTAVYIRNTIGSNLKIAALSPCIAKKQEFDETGLIQYNVTFSELEKYIKSKGVNLQNPLVSGVDFEFEHMQGVLGSLYSLPGGLRQNVEIYAPQVSVVQSEGTEVVYDKLDEYLSASKSSLPVLFDVLNCEFGCNGGPGVGGHYSHFKNHHVFADVKNQMLKRNKKLTRYGQNKLFKTFDKKLRLEDFIRVYDPTPVKLQNVTWPETEKAFESLGKLNSVDKNINCRYCGFKSCERMAVAVARGISTPENCAEYNVYKNSRQRKRVEAVLSESKQISDELYNITENFSQMLSDVSEKIEAIKHSANANYDGMSELLSKNEMLIKEIVGIGNSIEKINNATDGYDKITEEVEKIGNRINLVSLNAGIEAARAGEAGKGFAVVASEVRHLAMNSKDAVQSASESKSMIFSSVANVAKAADSIEQSVGAVTDMIGVSREEIAETALKSDVISKEVDAMAKLLSEIKALMQNSINMISSGLDD